MHRMSKTKPFRTSKPTSFFDPPSARLAFLHIDIIGPFTLVKGQRYALTVMDQYTRWPEVILIPFLISPLVQWLEFSWTVGYQDLEYLTSLCQTGTQFTSAIWTCVCREHGTVNRTTTSYHPESNRLIERFHRSLKTGLVVRILEEKENWMNDLPVVLWVLRNSVPMDQRSKIDADVGRLFETMEKVAHVPPRVTQRETFDNRLRKADYVFVKNKPIRESLSPTFLGPFKILGKYDRYFKLDLGG
nr:uncharacterized protein LOC121128837 [Lepeophtheirus salmonis]